MRTRSFVQLRIGSSKKKFCRIKIKSLKFCPTANWRFGIWTDKNRIFVILLSWKLKIRNLKPTKIWNLRFYRAENSGWGWDLWKFRMSDSAITWKFRLFYVCDFFAFSCPFLALFVNLFYLIGYVKHSDSFRGVPKVFLTSLISYLN